MSHPLAPFFGKSRKLVPRHLNTFDKRAFPSRAATPPRPPKGVTMARWHSNGSRGRHETVHRDARRTIAWLDAQPEVKKVILGHYKPGGGRGGRQSDCLTFRSECLAGLSVFATTGDGLHELTLIVDPDNRTRLLDKIAERWPGSAERARDPRRRLTTCESNA
jgi:hypothetical protein